MSLFLPITKVVTGTIPQLAEKYGIDKMVMVGILDGINDSFEAAKPNRNNG